MSAIDWKKEFAACPKGYAARIANVFGAEGIQTREDVIYYCSIGYIKPNGSRFYNLGAKGAKIVCEWVGEDLPSNELIEINLEMVRKEEEAITFLLSRGYRVSVRDDH